MIEQMNTTENHLEEGNRYNKSILKKMKDILEHAIKQIKQKTQDGPIKHKILLKNDNLQNNLSGFQMHNQKLKQMLSNLQKGYLMLKHSKNTNQPHNKFVYLSSDWQKLCWKSLEKQDQKCLQLRNISMVKNWPNLIGQIQSKTIKDIKKSFLILAESRNLQLEAISVEQAQQFYEQLQAAIKKAKKYLIHL